jgi:hypothetical protein
VGEEAVLDWDPRQLTMGRLWRRSSSSPRWGKAGAGCSRDLEPLEEALAGGGTTKRSSGEDRRGAEQAGAVA